MLPYRYLRVAASCPATPSFLFRCAAGHLELIAHRTLPHHSSIPRPQNRGKTTKSTVTLDAPLQVATALAPLPSEDEGPAYPTVVLQARSHMLKFENCVLLTRVGGFYELYFEHADEFGPLLNLKVAQKKVNGGRFVSMAGFPFFQLDRYLKILVQDLNRYVAIAEEFPHDPSSKVKAGGLMHDRRVSRIVTPGTLIDENFIDPLANNYILAIHSEDVAQNREAAESIFPIQASDTALGLAWLDLSTGHFFTQSTSLSTLPSFLARIGPREIVLDEKLRALKEHNLFTVIGEDSHLITYMGISEVTSISEWSPMLESPVPVKTLDEFPPLEVAAGSALLKYVQTRLQSSDMKLQPPSRQSSVMGIDRNTMTALEVKQTSRDSKFKGSLLHTIRRTVTQGGARLLERWLTSPSTSIEVINSRLDLVTYMLNGAELRERITILLKRCYDSQRLVQKFAFGRGDPDDVLALASTITATVDLVAKLKHGNDDHDCIQIMVSRIDLDGPATLASEIKQAIDEEGLVQQHRLEDEQVGEMQALAEKTVVSSGTSEDTNMLPKSSARKTRPSGIRDYYSDDNAPWIMKAGASPTLQHLHTDLITLNGEKINLEKSLSERYGLATLSLKFTPGLGHICHVKGKDTKVDISSHTSDSPIRSVRSSKSTRSFHHPEWTFLGQRIDQITVRIRSEEQAVFSSLRRAVISNIVKLRRNATVLDELDIACSLATLAEEKSWTRPIINSSTTHKIIGGRHPTVEGGLEEEGRTFVSNDCFVGSPHSIWLITGPNMAGKSTFLRQNALITILAQIGSYVPAQYAELGIVDQLFSRVGSADNLYKDQSTFMVEMLETANILKGATKRSFVVMDEIGRGTTPEDGEAVAYACLWHLRKRNGCRTLFATHFHGLVDLVEGAGNAEMEKLEGVGFYCTDVEEDEKGGFRYVHRLRVGINKQSHALKVARLAGLPEEAIDIAKEILGHIEDEEGQ
ncbi:hypothetical protein D0Z07_2435 [Hyphodiscus hymeniophilus]|uniref:DNA mismatch repair proteins mutS family domain-containing protein n=1 Tax=Hyphodiscus hymeniophilus TaxID=353542 RepID=A0A9P6VMF7_9HELO|nr:hypothetical protein D0Z07_2435 [Hyphodiscus hymeniophilus]